MLKNLGIILSNNNALSIMLTDFSYPSTILKIVPNFKYIIAPQITQFATNKMLHAAYPFIRSHL